MTESGLSPRFGQYESDKKSLSRASAAVPWLQLGLDLPGIGPPVAIPTHTMPLL